MIYNLLANTSEQTYIMYIFEIYLSELLVINIAWSLLHIA